MARRQGAINAFAKRFPSVAHLHVDLGGFFSSLANADSENVRKMMMTQNEWVIRAYDAMHLSAVNISFRDLYNLNRAFATDVYREQFATDVYREQSDQYPVLKQFISANVRPINDSNVAPQPYLIKTLTGPRLKRRLRIGLIGLTDAGPASDAHYTIEDPLLIAQRLLPEVQAQSDVVIVLGYLALPTAERLARSGLVSGAVLTAHRFPGVAPVRRFEKTLLVTAIDEAKALGEVTIYVNQTGQVTALGHRYLLLDNLAPDDPPLAALREEAHQALAASTGSQESDGGGR